MSKSSALSISVLLIFEMQLRNSALFLSANFLSYALLFGFVTFIFPVTIIYASVESHRSDLKIDVLNLICFYSIVCSSRLVMNFYPFFSNKSRHFIRCVS